MIHGQVTVGWGSQLKPRRYVVVDDVLPDSDFERDLYSLGTPVRTESEFYTVEHARAHLLEWGRNSDPTILLTRDLDHMLRLAEGGMLGGESVNLGGIHHKPGRSGVLTYLYLDEGDRGRISRLEAEGVAVWAQDLPGSPRIPSPDLLDA